MPGAGQGVRLGEMTGGEAAIVIDGPVELEGDLDTIVWWKVRTANGIEAWAPANTSWVTLLEPE